jgi:hypothetical protein
MRERADGVGLLVTIVVLPMAWAACSRAESADAAGAPTHPAVAREMAGVWLPDSRRSDRPQWTLNDVARQAAARYTAQYGPVDPTLDDVNASCIPESMPYPMRLIAQYPFEILFTPGRMTMFFEVFGTVRRIPISVRPSALESLPSAMGRSIGHWEGDTLVIETDRIRRAGAGTPFGDPPVSNARRIVERLSMGVDPNGRKELRNQIIIHDPVVLAAPVTMHMVYKWSPDIEVGEYLCQQDIWDQNQQGSPSTVPWRQ